MMKQTQHGDGYLQIGLYKNGLQTKYLVHRLVAQAFVSNPENLSFVNHKDEVKDNNNSCNLEWCTHSYNMNYGNANKKTKSKFNRQ